MGVPSIQQSVGSYSSNSASVSATLSSAVSSGDTLVAFIGMSDTSSRTVSSVSDGHNTWTQVAGAFVSAFDGTDYWNLDVWIATGAQAVSSLTVTANISGHSASAVFDIYLFDLSACTAAAASNNSTTSLTPFGNWTVPNVPSSSGAALFLAAIEEEFGNGDVPQSPWTELSGANNHNMNHGYLSESSAASPTLTWTRNAGNTTAVSSIVALTSSGGGGGNTGTPPFLGSVVVNNSGPAASGPFLGTVAVLASPPSGNPNSYPFLGTVAIRNTGVGVPAPGSNSYPFLGQVCEISAPPSDPSGWPNLGRVDTA